MTAFAVMKSNSSLFYVREAHPRRNHSRAQLHARETEAARLLRDEEDMKMPILVDDLRGSIHRKYSRITQSGIPHR